MLFTFILSVLEGHIKHVMLNEQVYDYISIYHTNKIFMLEKKNSLYFVELHH